MARRVNTGLGDMELEENRESENYGRNKKKMKGHVQDSRFDEGSTHGQESAKIVRPSKSAKTMAAKHEGERKWNLGSDHKI
jgi:hypothetical protein